MNTYIDIGINLTNRQFEGEIDNCIQNALDVDVERMIVTGTNVKNSIASEKIAAQYPNTLYSTAGIHPHDAKSMNEQSIDTLKKLLQKKHVVSVGECGLDFDRDFSPRPVQEQCYRAQLELAITVQKPLFLHERAAFDRFTSITKSYLSQLPPAVVHCFTGTLAEAKTYLDLGFYLGFTGAISDMRRFAALKEVVAYVPLDRLMIETDAPFMLPKNVPANQLKKYHERRNEPAFLPYIAGTVAQYKGIPLHQVATETTNNAIRFFSLT